MPVLEPEWGLATGPDQPLNLVSVREALAGPSPARTGRTATRLETVRARLVRAGELAHLSELARAVLDYQQLVQPCTLQLYGPIPHPVRLGPASELVPSWPPDRPVRYVRTQLFLQQLDRLARYRYQAQLTFQASTGQLWLVPDSPDHPELGLATGLAPAGPGSDLDPWLELPARTHQVQLGHPPGVTVRIVVVLQPQTGQPCRIFLHSGQPGQAWHELLQLIAELASQLLQLGRPLAELCQMFRHVTFEPAGPTSNPQLAQARSVLDYLAQWLTQQFLDPDPSSAVGPVPGPDPARLDLDPSSDPQSARPGPSLPGPRDGQSGPQLDPQLQPSFQRVVQLVGHSSDRLVPRTEPRARPALADPDRAGPAVGPTRPLARQDAVACPSCGSLAVRAGTCYVCPNCGTTTGCS